MVEGDNVFKEAIQFLKSLPPLKPLQWDPNLARSAQEHVDDIGPKGLLLYQSSDGTEPEDRISKYGTYVDSLGENIDFGPNDAMGVIISLTLDDGEEERPHRENLFKADYQKVGIACGQHKTEFQMCVMDFAFDFQPLKSPSSQLEFEKLVEENKQLKETINQNNSKYAQEINQLKDENKNLIMKNGKLQKENKHLREEKAKANKIIDGFKNIKTDNNDMKKLKEEIVILKYQLGLKDSEINNLKIKLQNNIIEEPKFNMKDIMVINFISIDASVHYGIKCLENDVFAEVEEKLYKKYDDLRNTNNMFTVNVRPVLRFKTMKENKIKDGDIIQLIKLE